MMLFIIFSALVIGLAAALALKIRHHLSSPFLRSDQRQGMQGADYDKVIEGEYTVIDKLQK